MTRIAVLGCGPSGLAAAHALVHAGHEPVIYSRKRKSDLFGAQYLHAPLPGMPEGERRTVTYETRGTALDYRFKVYGPLWDGTVSPEDLANEHHAWDIRAAYDWLWDEYSDAIVDAEIAPAFMADIVAQHGSVVSTLPAQQLCTQGCSFGFTEIWAAGDAPARGISVPYQCPDETIICNGEPEPSWYRISNVFGHKTVEWPGDMKMQPPVPTVARVVKPTKTNCRCWPNVIRAGRYGSWRKGVLVHHVYWDVLEATMDLDVRAEDLEKQ